MVVNAIQMMRYWGCRGALHPCNLRWTLMQPRILRLASIMQPKWGCKIKFPLKLHTPVSKFLMHPLDSIHAQCTTVVIEVESYHRPRPIAKKVHCNDMDFIFSLLRRTSSSTYASKSMCWEKRWSMQYMQRPKVVPWAAADFIQQLKRYIAVTWISFFSLLQLHTSSSTYASNSMCWEKRWSM